MKQILFVCLGNICRSPAAEGILNSIIEKKLLSDKMSCDSAGTSAYHEGEPADARMQSHAKERGHNLTSLARGFNPEIDFQKFDIIVTMDESNFRNLCLMDQDQKYIQKIVRMTNYCKIHNVTEVPDPYFGGDKGFELVLDILEDACEQLANKVSKE